MKKISSILHWDSEYKVNECNEDDIKDWARDCIKELSTEITDIFNRNIKLGIDDNIPTITENQIIRKWLRKYVLEEEK